VFNLFTDPSEDFIWFAAAPVGHKAVAYLKNPEETNSPSQVNLKFVRYTAISWTHRPVDHCLYKLLHNTNSVEPDP